MTEALMFEQRCSEGFNGIKKVRKGQDFSFPFLKKVINGMF